MHHEKRFSTAATIDGPPYTTRIQVRDHVLISDEPIEEGGANAGPKAHELLCSALASCTAITIRMYTDRKQWPVRAIRVNVDMHRVVEQGAVRSDFRMTVDVDGDLDDAQRARILQIAGMCPVHKTLQHPIGIHTELA